MVKVISLPYIFLVFYVLCFTGPRYQVSVYRTIGPLVLSELAFYHHKRHILSGYSSKRIERYLKQVLFYRGMLIYSYENAFDSGNDLDQPVHRTVWSKSSLSA